MGPTAKNLIMQRFNIYRLLAEIADNPRFEKLTSTDLYDYIKMQSRGHYDDKVIREETKRLPFKG